MDWKIISFGIGLAAILIALPSCTSVQMKRCPEKFEDEEVLQCDDAVQGIYRDCQKPKNLFKCSDPQ